MAEVFQGTPGLVSVRIDGPKGRMKQYHIAGRDMSDVAEAVRLALVALPDEETIALKAKKERKPRRTKVEMLADKDLASQPTEAEAHNKSKKEVWP